MQFAICISRLLHPVCAGEATPKNMCRQIWGIRLSLMIWWLWCQKQVSRAGIKNYNPQNTVGESYLSLPEPPASRPKFFNMSNRNHKSMRILYQYTLFGIGVRLQAIHEAQPFDTFHMQCSYNRTFSMTWLCARWIFYTHLWYDFKPRSQYSDLANC